MRTFPFLIAAALALTACATAGPPAPAAPVKLFDIHAHLMVENLKPDEEMALLKGVGLDRVLLMHTNAQELAAVSKQYRGFAVPSLGITRAAGNPNLLRLDANTAPAMAKAHADGGACAFGEIGGGTFADPNMPAIYAVAAATGAPVIQHTDLAQPGAIAAVEAALTKNPKMNMVLAHLGWTAGPDLIGRLLDAHPNLYTDVSIRFDAPGSLPWRNNGLDLSILAPDETIPPAWMAVMQRHPDRFLFATDINSFGPRYTIEADLVATARKAMAGMPRPLAEAFGHGNAERLLKGCGA
jgi:hypothetical protein